MKGQNHKPLGPFFLFNVGSFISLGLAETR